MEFQAVTFTATVSPANATGTVTFLTGGNVLASDVALTAGIAIFQSQLQLPVGVDSITASYSGDQNYNASQSAVLKQTVIPAPPMATISAVVNGADFVSPPAPGGGCDYIWYIPERIFCQCNIVDAAHHSQRAHRFHRWGSSAYLLHFIDPDQHSNSVGDTNWTGSNDEHFKRRLECSVNYWQYPIGITSSLSTE